ncbi:septum formation initiator family protein [Desulfobacterales bacterium HSG2]|nr:septum formation initiator family protein [Desulfobacterales bacterium HSG2]
MVNLKKNMLLCFFIGVMFCLSLMIIFGDKGLADLNFQKKILEGLIKKNEAVMRENLSLSRSIDRLKKDPAFIEHEARNELGMIRKNEMICVYSYHPETDQPAPKFSKIQFPFVKVEEEGFLSRWKWKTRSTDSSQKKEGMNN